MEGRGQGRDQGERHGPALLALRRERALPPMGAPAATLCCARRCQHSAGAGTALSRGVRHMLPT